MAEAPRFRHHSPIPLPRRPIAYRRCALATPALADPPQTETIPASWPLATRIAFRFCVVYFGLYCLSTQILTTLLSNPRYDFPDPSSIPPWRPIITFVATRLFHHKAALVFTGSGSGDKTVDLILMVCLFTVALVVTIAWSLLDRRRTSYPTLHRWVFLFIRFALAGQMLVYGFAKAVPLQMSFPNLVALLEPYGNFSPMGVLWNSVGASPPYEIFVGCLEILGGLLLLIPRTLTLGALISLLDMSYVFLLNMTYDVPVKFLSFHLILLSLFLLAPQFQRFANFFFLNRTAEPAPSAPLFHSLGAHRIAFVVGVVYALWLIGNNVYGDRLAWKTYGPGLAKPALYGIWDVEQFTVDGQARPPLLTDTTRWRRLVFERFEFGALYSMNDTPSYYEFSTDSKQNNLTLTLRRPANTKISLTYSRPTPDQLLLDGPIDGHPTHIQLRLEDRNKFLLVSRGFHWIQEYPFNR